MGTLANVIMRAIGLGKAVDALDGETSKAYIAGVMAMLGGAVSISTALIHILNLVFQAHGGAAYYDIFKAIQAGNADTVLLGAGYLAIAKGYADIGHRHALAEIANAQGDPAPAPAPAAPPPPDPAK